MSTAAIIAASSASGASTVFGHLNLADGSSYIGEFASDTYEGRGILTLADGNTQSGIWANGQRVRDANGKLLPDQLELGLLAQGPLLDKALSAVPASTPAIELYSLVLAGDGKQSVFMREADYVNSMLASRFGAYGQISLVNHRDHLLDRPMATRENLHRAAQTLAERSGPEDLIFIYLTSHGTHDHELVLDQPRLELADLPADEMASALAPLKNRDKVIVISACYSGGFIPALKDEKTLIMTASRADRVSFGCSEEADFTYFRRRPVRPGTEPDRRLAASFQPGQDPRRRTRTGRQLRSLGTADLGAQGRTGPLAATAQATGKKSIAKRFTGQQGSQEQLS